MTSERAAGAQAARFMVDRFEAKTLGRHAALVTLHGRWGSGAEPSGRAVLLAEQGGTMLAFAPLVQEEVSTGAVVASLSLPAKRLADAGTRFLLKAEGDATVHLEPPATSEGSAAGPVEAHPAVGTGRRHDARPSGGRGELEKRIRDLERDLKRANTARSSLEGALKSSSNSGEALERLRAEKAELEDQLEFLKIEREKFNGELASVKESGRAWAQRARALEDELEALRQEAEGNLRRLEPSARQLGEARKALDAEREARAGAEEAHAAARGEANREREARERAQSEVAAARREAELERAGLSDSLDRVRAKGRARLEGLTSIEHDLGQLAQTARDLTARAEGAASGSGRVANARIGASLADVRRRREEATTLEQRIEELNSAISEASS